MRSFIAALAAFVLLVSQPGVAAEEEPTREEVLAALDGMFEGPESERGEARFLAWGDAALPVLESLASEPEGVRHAPALNFALHAIATEGAADLLVRMLEGETLVPGFLTAAILFAARGELLEHLSAHPRFKAAALQYMSGMSAQAILHLCATLQWVDQIDRIRGLLNDPDADIRKAAAKTLLALTGEEIGGAPASRHFAAEAIVPELVGSAVYIPRQQKRDPKFLAAMPWFDGLPHLIYGFDGGIPAHGHRAELRIASGTAPQHAKWPTSCEVQELEFTPTRDGETQLIAMVDEDHPAGRPSDWEAVVAWTADGEQRWRWDCDDRFLNDMALLHGEDGPVGVAVGVGGDIGVVALDLEGQECWNIPRRYVIHQLRSHPGVPGHVLLIGSGSRIIQHTASELTGEYEFDDVEIYERRGLLFPDAAGKPAVVLAGTRPRRDVHALCRVAHGGGTVWEAWLPAEITALDLIEADGLPRLLVLTTDQGELYVVDEAGTLRWRGKLPFARDDGGVQTLRLAAGEIAPGEYGILVKQVQSCYVLPVHVDRLRALLPVPIDAPREPGSE